MKKSWQKNQAHFAFHISTQTLKRLNGPKYNFKLLFKSVVLLGQWLLGNWFLYHIQEQCSVRQNLKNESNSAKIKMTATEDLTMWRADFQSYEISFDVQPLVFFLLCIHLCNSFAHTNRVYFLPKRITKWTVHFVGCASSAFVSTDELFSVVVVPCCCCFCCTLVS